MILEFEDKDKIISILNCALEDISKVNRVRLEVAEDFATPEARAIKMSNRPEWPEAVDPVYIVDFNSEPDKKARAEAIMNLFLDVKLEGRSVLDFGCGEGHLVELASSRAAKAVGYDISRSGWENRRGGYYFDNFEDVVKSGPYDVVVAFDVFDHMLNEEQVPSLRNIAKVLNVGGSVHVRFHPFCSRHGTHLHTQVNKAFMHLVFTEEEIAAMGYTQTPTVKVIHPLATYDNWIKLAGFQVSGKPEIHTEPIEPFFEKNYRSQILRHYKKSWDKNLRDGTSFPVNQLQMTFVDYVLTYPGQRGF